jgi:tetratricopeptide (TPR) repeat protein
MAPDPRFMQALRSRRSGNSEEARRILEGMLADDPDCTDALEVLGMMLSEEGELDRAIQLTEHLAELLPDSVMAHANLSRFHMLKGDKETAEDWQGKARVLGWKEEMRTKAASASGSKSNLDEGVDPDVVERQEQAVEQDPDSILARMALAGSYRKLGMPAKSVGHLKHALSLDDGMSVVYLELGRSLEAANMRDEAIQVYRRGIPVADRKGDLMPRNQMQTRLAALEKAAS